MMINELQNLDTQLPLLVQEHIRCDFLDPIMMLASHSNDYGIICIATCFVLVVVKKTRRGGIMVGASLGLEVVACNILLKNIIQRPRPYLAMENLQILVAHETSFSFPSGHTASSFAVAYALTRAFGRRGAWAYLPAATISASRLYVGVHYPSDIICGAVLGTVAAAVACKILTKIPFKILRKK